MSIQYAGGTIVNTTYTSDGTRQGIVTALNTQLKNAGWSVISGDGTANVILQTATTPQNAFCQVNLVEPGSGNCAQVLFRNSTGSKIANAAFLLPTNGSIFRILANKYQFFFFQSGIANTAIARTCVMGGVLWLPTFMATYLGSDLQHWWSHFNGTSDTTTTASPNFRTTVTGLYTGASAGSAMMSSALLNYTNGFFLPSVRTLIHVSTNTLVPTWLDGSYPVADALVDWGASGSATGPTNCRGLIWDGIVLHGASLNTETPISGPDGNTYMVITHAVGVQLCIRSA